jgi:hypothetical protein
MAGLLIPVIFRISSDEIERLTSFFALFFLPLGWMVSAVYPQDEIIGALAFAGIIWACLLERFRTARFLLSGSVAAVKIFFFFPALLFALFSPGRIALNLAETFLPGVLLFSYVLGHIAMRGQPLPDFLSITPDNNVGVNAWTLIVRWTGMAFETAKRISTLTVFFAIGAAALVLWWRSDKLPCSQRLFRAMDLHDSECVTFLLYLLLFGWVATVALEYLALPEYFAPALPLLILLFRRPIAAALVSFTFLLALDHKNCLWLAKNRNGNAVA